ncbi:MAG TPA: RNA polymerase sigma-70 factor [Chitinophagaceae bacterium]|nr:RNA polymerase sigma-70 factor [Chitinophagaceae bacterium]
MAGSILGNSSKSTIFISAAMMNNSNSYNESCLLKKVKNGDEFAFRVIYDTYHKNIFFLGKKFLRSQSAAEDLVQEVFVKIWSNRHKLTEIKDFRKYLNTITINQIYNLLKRQAFSENYISGEHLSMVQVSSSGIGVIDNHELQHLLQQATKQLPPQQKKAFELSRYHGLKHEQIAEHMEISRETVKKHCMEAARNIKSWLKRRGIDACFLLFLLF